MVTFLLFLVIGCFVGWKCVRLVIINRRYTNLLNKIPGPPCQPLFGNLFVFPRHPVEFWKRVRAMSKEYYPIYRIWGSYIPTVNLLCPKDIELVLSNVKHHKKSWLYRCLKPWLGTGLLTSSGFKWHNRRKMLTPTFHFNILQQFVGIFNEQSEILVNQLKDEVDKPYTVINHFISNFTLSTICETAMGTRLDPSDISQTEYFDSIYKMGKLVVYRIARPWLFFNCMYKLTTAFKKEKKLEKVLHDFSMSVIEDRKTRVDFLNLTNKRKMAMLDLLITAKNKGEFIDNDGIREEVDTFMFEGHDTTAACLTFTLMLLACHKDVQDNVVEELCSVRKSLDEPLTFMDLQNLRYLERVLKESLRMYPSVPFIGRITGEEIVTTTGYTIPKNCNVHVHIYDLHYNPEVYPDPYKFDPDRFLPENSHKRHPFAYLPFSAGPRNCIGQKFAILELKSAISALLTEYVLEPIDHPQDICLTTDLVLRSADGIKIKFSKRENKYVS